MKKGANNHNDKDPHEIHDKSSKSPKHKIIKTTIILILFVLAAGTGMGMGYVAHLDSKIQRPTKNEFDKSKIVVNKEQPIEDEEEYKSIAIFGIDARNHSLGEGNRSDCIIIASINNKTKDVKLTSVYRDTLVQVPGHGYDKLTHAYAFGGPELALSTMNLNFDLNITDYVTVNFSIAEDIIDLLGGVTINVDPSEVKWVNGYVRSLAKEGADTNVSYISGSGEQVLTGSQAVAYTRIRRTQGGDFKRAKRQRIMMDAALAKAKTQNLATLNSIIEAVSQDIYTNFTTTEILNLAKDIFKYEIKDSEGFPYHVKNAKVLTPSSNGLLTAVGIPSTLAEDLKTLHFELYGEGSPSTQEAPSDSIFSSDTDQSTANTASTEDAATNQTAQEDSTPSTTKKEYSPSQTTVGIDQELKNMMP